MLAIWLSNLCTGDGSQISDYTWSGLLKCDLPYTWPRTIKPTLGEWKIWQAILSKCFALDRWLLWTISLDNGNHWQTCGAGTKTLPLTICDIQKESNGYVTVRFLPNHGQNLFTRWQFPMKLVHPQQLQCTTITATGQKLVLSGVGTMYTLHLEETVGLDALLALPIAKEWNLKIWVQGKLNHLWMELTIENGFVVSDGSFSPGMGTAVWIIEGWNSEHHLTRVWTTLGTKTDHSAFCSELWGIYSILLTLSYLPPSTRKPTF